jgi:hypothetical protein
MDEPKKLPLMCEILEDPFKIKQFHLTEYDCMYDNIYYIEISTNPFLQLLRIPSFRC